MKVISTTTLIDKGDFTKTDDFELILEEVYSAIENVVWPPGNSTFVLNPTRNGNGVVPIKNGFLTQLESFGWLTEERMKIITENEPGKVDALKVLPDGRGFVIEWETGNISSSHRALNKMSMGLLTGAIIGGMLIVPTREMYTYLTDRVGNLPELIPYFDIWRDVSAREGFLAVVAVEHDELSDGVPQIEKGTDGRALV